MIESKPGSAEEQIEIPADLYGKRARPHDTLWSPVIHPVGERLLGRGDRSTGLDRIQFRLGGEPESSYTFGGEIVMATACKTAHNPA
jgi:hypothetical protein